MTNQPQLDALIALIEERRQSSDRETIKQQLLQSGADPQIVEQALARVYDAAPVTQPMQPAAQTMPNSEIARIRAYLEQYRHVYDRQALRQKLLEDGHDPQAVDMAIAQVYGFQVQPTAAPKPTNTTAVILIAMGLFIFNYVLWSLLAALTFQGDSLVGLTAIPIVLALEIAAAVALRRRNRSAARGLAWGIAASILPIVALALLFGICVAIINSGF